jgi:hypothetical protein
VTLDIQEGAVVSLILQLVPTLTTEQRLTVQQALGLTVFRKKKRLAPERCETYHPGEPSRWSRKRDQHVTKTGEVRVYFHTYCLACSMARRAARPKRTLPPCVCGHPRSVHQRECYFQERREYVCDCTQFRAKGDSR